VPVLAISLALARGLGGADAAKLKIQEAVNEWTQSFAAQAVVVSNTNNVAVVGAGIDGNGNIVEGADTLDSDDLATQINKMVEDGFEKVENISFAALGGFGLILLLWMVISVLGRVEGSFNQVWGITKGRPLWRKFTDYLSILILLPILIVATSSLPVADFITNHAGNAANTMQNILSSDFLRRVTFTFMTTLCFGFTIMFMPNTKVKLWPALSGGFVSGVLFIGWLWICAAIQVGAAKYGKIYGSFAIVPIILAWVYVSWQIVLFGAEVAFAVQNCSTYQMEQGSERASFKAKIILAVSLIVEAARQMIGDNGGFNVEEYARAKGIPVRLLNDVIKELVSLGIFAEVNDNDGGIYVLLKTPGNLMVYDIVKSFSNAGVAHTKLGLGNIDPALVKIFDKVDAGVDERLKGVTVLQLAEDLQ
jgi:membrane protein